MKFDQQLTENAKKYLEIQKQISKLRITNLLKFSKEETILEEQLENIWNNSTDEQKREIDDVPSYWWFQCVEDGMITLESELTKYDYAKYFINQEPVLTKIEKDKKTFFGNNFDEYDVRLYFIYQKPLESRKKDEFEMPQIHLSVETMSHNEYELLQKRFKFDRYSHDEKFPIFVEK
jgi:hypothetical protein